jgi:hypothetical protein
VFVYVPIPPPPRLELPASADGGLAEQPVRAPHAAGADEPETVSLQPAPILEVRIHPTELPLAAAISQKPTGPGPAAVMVSSAPVEPEFAVKSIASPGILVNNPVAANNAVANPRAVPVSRAVSSLPAPSVITKDVPAEVPTEISTEKLETAANHGASVKPIARGPVVSAPIQVNGDDGGKPQTQGHDASGQLPGQDEDGAVVIGVEAGPRTGSRIFAVPDAPVTVQTQPGDALPIQPITHSSNSAGAATVPVPPLVQPPMTATTKPIPDPPATNSTERQEPPIDQARPQPPLRSLALEFTPDGGGDIKVRLSERSGDVHISLHGTDASLAGRVREGVSDLMGSLSRAGYDAEAWTPDQRGQSQQRPPDQRKSTRGESGAIKADDFSGILQQPIQEIS